MELDGRVGGHHLLPGGRDGGRFISAEGTREGRDRFTRRAGVPGHNLCRQRAQPRWGRLGARRSEGAGAKILKPAQEAFWGGYSGYFADPDDFLWEVAWNPYFSIAEDGSIQIPG